MKRCYFITATGTDLGKTWLTAGISGNCRERGLPARALKPVMSGFDATQAGASDAGVLLQQCGQSASEENIAAIAPWRFAAPLSPDLAAAREGRALDFDALISWCRQEIEASDGLLLIEGIGGVMVPLSAQHTVRDWMAALALPIVLVSGSYLGALSHTLTALVSLQACGLNPALLVVNAGLAGAAVAGGNQAVSLDDTLSALRPHLGDIPLLTVGHEDRAGCARVTDFLLG